MTDSCQLSFISRLLA